MKAELNNFLFQPVNARTTAWFRILLSIFIPWLFWSEGTHFAQNAPEWLHHPQWDFVLSHGYWIFLSMLCLLLMLGWKSRYVALLLCIALLPLDFLTRGAQSRQVILFALLAFSFLKSDTIQAPWKKTAKDKFVSAGPAWPLRLIQLQLTLLYGINAYKKSSSDYLSGDALMAMSAVFDNFKVDLTSGYLVMWGCSIPVMILAIGSTLSEYVLALGFWLVKRKWLIALFGLMFHIALLFIVQIYRLDIVSIFLYLSFLLPFLPPQPEQSANDIKA